MTNNNYKLMVFATVLGLTGCNSTNTSYTTSDNYQSQYQDTYYDDSLYPQYETMSNPPRSELSERKMVQVPDSYHVGAYHSPARHANRDKEWVSQQQPDGYTIELANSDKPSQVAKTLYKTPKNERMAEVKSQHGGKVYYQGLYGSYKTRAEAEQALSALPADLKPQAEIRSWNKVQAELTE